MIVAQSTAINAGKVTYVGEAIIFCPSNYLSD